MLASNECKYLAKINEELVEYLVKIDDKLVIYLPNIVQINSELLLVKSLTRINN